MELAFAGRLLAACAVVAVVLAVVHYGARLALPARLVSGERSPLLAIVETTFLPGAASLHVVRVAQRYYVVGRSGAHIQALCEIPPEDVAPRQERSARASGALQAALRGVGARLRGPVH